MQRTDSQKKVTFGKNNPSVPLGIMYKMQTAVFIPHNTLNLDFSRSLRNKLHPVSFDREIRMEMGNETIEIVIGY